jgi:fimbrial chaperone protein
MNSTTRLILLAVSVFCTLGIVQSGSAANFSVEPVRVVLDAQHRTERMVIKNDSDLPLTVLIKAYQWTQVEHGKDLYKESEALIIFPRALTLAAGEERFVRVGMATPTGPQEQAFRIYLEEQPVRDEQTPKGAGARIMMRVGIPVFAQSLKQEPTLKTSELSVVKGKLFHTIINNGNSFSTTEQITVNGLDDKGAELFARNLGGGYLLAGSSRIYEFEIPEDQCRRVSHISVTTRSEGNDQLNKLKMASSGCEDR